VLSWKLAGWVWNMRRSVGARYEVDRTAASALRYAPRIVQKILDPRTGRTVRLYQCECGERVWDD